MKSIKCLIIFAFLSAYMLIGCSTNRSHISSELKNYVLNNHDQSKKIDYKLVSFDIVDTLYNKDLMASFDNELHCGFLCPDKDIQSVKDMKNNDMLIDYLKDLGDLEIDENIAAVDSLLKNWDKVTRYSYTLNYLTLWFGNKEDDMLGVDYDKDENRFIWLIQNKDKYELADSITHCNPKDLYAFKVMHRYSIFDPMLQKRIETLDEVLLDKNLNYMSSRTAPI